MKPYIIHTAPSSHNHIPHTITRSHTATTANTSSNTTSSTTSENLNSSYELSSVVVHQGSATFGHYMCYARPDPTNRPDYWLLLNDHIVTDVSYEDVCRAAYGNSISSSTKERFLGISSDNNSGGEGYSNGREDNNKCAYLLFYSRKVTVAAKMIATATTGKRR